MTSTYLNISNEVEAYTWALKSENYSDVYALARNFCIKHEKFLNDVAVASHNYIICYDELNLDTQCANSEKTEVILFCYLLLNSEVIATEALIKNELVDLVNYLAKARDAGLIEMGIDA
jgi:hypothetical protein